MYKIVITKKIFSPVDLRGSGNPVTDLYHELELPFPPFVGLRIALPKTTIGPINNVVYDAQTDQFICGLDHSSFGLEELHKAEEAIEKAEEAGWRIKD